MYWRPFSRFESNVRVAVGLVRSLVTRVYLSWILCATVISITFYALVKVTLAHNRKFREGGKKIRTLQKERNISDLPNHECYIMFSLILRYLWDISIFWFHSYNIIYLITFLIGKSVLLIFFLFSYEAVMSIWAYIFWSFCVSGISHQGYIWVKGCQLLECFGDFVHVLLQKTGNNLSFW